MNGMGMRGPRWLAGAALVCATCLAGCSDLAEGGPRASAVRAGASATLPYSFVPITAATLATVTQSEPDRLAGAFPVNKPPARLVLGIGDVLSINIYEASVGGLFIPGDTGSRPGNYVSLPSQTVDPAGNISFPFGGAVRVAGRTPQQVQDAVIARIKDRAIDPQVIVAVVLQQTSLVSVEGDVRAPARYPAAAAGAGDRVSDALTRAGGLTGAGWESWVTLERDGRSATVPYEALLSRPANDIFVQPGDRLLVYRQAQSFVALGALGPRPPTIDTGGLSPLLDGGRATISFGNWRLSLAEAIGKAGGLLDARADPGSVFVYRREPAAVARRIGVDPGPLDVVPVIYGLDLSDPAGFLLATRFPMRNGDVLYVANARAVAVTKAVDYIGAYVSTVSNAASAALVGNSALRGSGTSGLTTVGGLTLVPSGVTGLPGTITASGLANGVSATTTPTGGTGDNAGTVGTGRTATRTSTAADAAMVPLVTPRATMASPTSR